MLRMAFSMKQNAEPASEPNRRGKAAPAATPPQVVRRRQRPGVPPQALRSTPPPATAAAPAVPGPVARPVEAIGPPPPPPVPLHLVATEPVETTTEHAHSTGAGISSPIGARVWHLSQITSRCRADLAAHNRIDPYWSDWFPYHSSEMWLSRASAERRIAAGLLDVPDKLLASPKENAMAAILQSNGDRSPYRLNSYIAAVGAITGWRTCTSQQLAALVGDPRLAPHLSHPLAKLFDAGLVERTVPSAWAAGSAKDVVLYRATHRHALSPLIDHLTRAEWLGVTGGQPYAGGGHHDRHNVLATELGLRLAEYTEASVVLGEPFCTPNHLIGEGVGRPIRDEPGGTDLVAVRSDGLRIAIELTSTTSPHFDKKVARLAKLLAEGPLEYTGLVVIFVLAPSLSAPAGHGKELLRETEQAIAEACRLHPGTSLDPTRARMAIATWESWFPAARTASEGFLSMRASRIAQPTPYAPGRTWESVDFLSTDARPFAPRYPDRMFAILSNAGLLGQTPYWMRKSLLSNPRTYAAVDQPDSTGRGAARGVRVPPRLLGLGTAAALARLGRQLDAGCPPGSEVPARPVAHAGRARSEALLHVTAGTLNVDDVMTAARKGGPTHAFRSISLKQLLIAQPRVGPASANRLLNRLSDFLGEPRPDPERETIGWLLDGRTASKRVAAWNEARSTLDVRAGFPWT